MIRSGTRTRLAVLALALLAHSALAAGVTLPPFHRFELGNGTVLLLSQEPEVPMVSVTAILRGGAVADPPGRGGLAPKNRPRRSSSTARRGHPGAPLSGAKG